MANESTLKTYTVHASIIYEGRKGYKVSSFMPDHPAHVYTANTFSAALRAVARDLRGMSKHIDAHAKALDDVPPQKRMRRDQ